MIVNKNKIVQEHGEPLISRNGASKASHSDRVVVPSDPEVSAKAFRRRFTAEYKLGILKEAGSCTELGSLGALLRREGLYSSNLNTWKQQRDRGVLSGLTPKKRGRKESGRHPLLAENEKLRKENDRLTGRLRQAEIIIDVQKKYQRSWGYRSRRPPRKEGATDGSRSHSFSRYRDCACLQSDRALPAPYLPRNDRRFSISYTPTGLWIRLRKRFMQPSWTKGTTAVPSAPCTASLRRIRRSENGETNLPTRPIRNRNFWPRLRIKSGHGTLPN